MQSPAASLFVFALLLCTSCATILNHKTYDLTVRSSQPGDKAEINQKIYDLPATVNVIRSKNILPVKLISGISEIAYKLYPTKDPYFYLNFFSPAWGGFLVDLTNQKRFSYGPAVFLNKYDTVLAIGKKLNHTPYFKRHYPTGKGDINWTISLPYINNFYLKPNGEPTKSNTGFFGISTGLEYYYSDRKFLSVRGDAALDFPVPIPAPVDRFGPYESISSTYVGVTDNFVLNRITLGYGVNVASNSWSLSQGSTGDSIADTRDTAFKRSWSAGLTLNAYHQVSKSFFIGVIYRPSILRTSPVVEFKYEHLITLDLAWKIALRRKDDY